MAVTAVGLVAFTYGMYSFTVLRPESLRASNEAKRSASSGDFSPPPLDSAKLA